MKKIITLLLITFVLLTGCKNNNINEVQNSNNQSIVKVDNNNNNSLYNLENVKKEDNKVNIYFFWGNGCPHCADEHDFFKEIEVDYGQYFNLYTFEVWYNEENAKLLEIFADNMNDTISGVPYTIIGNNSFTGFNESKKDIIISAIKNQSNNNFDVYIDKIKENS